MSQTARQRRADHKNRGGSSVDMNLVSLIDVFTILIFFLLAQVGPVDTLPSPKAVQLPASNSEKDPKDSVVLVISGTEILVEGRKVATVAEAMAGASEVIPGLKAELDIQARRVAVRAENKKNVHTINVMADKDVPYQVLRRVMVTCSQANFADMSFALRRKEGKDGGA
jgi:biopolymer transport protein TolR